MDTMKSSLEYGKQYRLLRINGEVVEGEHIQTKGNDGGYPTFRLPEGGLLSVAIANVLGPVIDDCPVDGIPRTLYIRCGCGAEASGNADHIESWWTSHVSMYPEIEHDRWDYNPVTVKGEIATMVDRITVPPKPESIITAIYKDDPNGYVKYEISEGQ